MTHPTPSSQQNNNVVQDDWREQFLHRILDHRYCDRRFCSNRRGTYYRQL